MLKKPVQVKLGQIVEVDGVLYEVVSDGDGGAVLEPAITLSVAEIHELTGGRPLRAAEFEDLFGDVPFDEGA